MTKGEHTSHHKNLLIVNERRAAVGLATARGALEAIAGGAHSPAELAKATLQQLDAA